ncbi:OmpA family protein [Oceanivirga salmonicida]|uniref:OmpA family protein n=1 Tax=Oceanivirga salmonicida TaxID=1769291 RepID=UPI0008375406|nr:OmpA family protein [Oceanivirga salmonicida]
MKKIAIIALTFAAMNTFAWEWNVKTGFDAYRDHVKFATKPSLDNTNGMGFTLGTEIIPIDTGVFELGVGAEYNFGYKSLHYNSGPEVLFKKGTTAKNEKEFIPIYAVTHLNFWRNKKDDAAAYVVGRLGGMASREKVGDPFKPGLYYGLGLGVEYNALVAELLYDGGFTPKDLKAAGNKAFDNKVGIRVGLRLGSFIKKAPVVQKEVVKPEPVVVEPIVVEPIVEPTPEPVVPVVEEPVIVEVERPDFIHGNCSSETKICTIYGFKVDGRVPNAQEQKNLKEIVDMVNNFAVSGDIDVVGHTDATGSVKYNQKLSVERAKQITMLLQKYGLSNSIKVNSITGKGELEPAATNKTKQGRYMNRRVELKFSELVK